MGRSADNDPVFAGLLGLVHGLVGTFYYRILHVVVLHLGHASAECDEHLVVAMQEELLGEFALQSGQRLDGIFQVGFGEQNDEFLPAVTGDGILRALRFAADLGQVNQCGITGIVPHRVVQLLEIVDVEEGDAQRGVVPFGAGRFLGEHVFESATIECAR